MQVRSLQEDKKVSKRALIATIIIVVCIPLTLAGGAIWFQNDIGNHTRSYYFVSLFVIILALIPFMLIFESRKPETREVVVISVLVAIAVIGRVIFFMLPQFKPVVAIVIIAAVCLGPESGFIIGALAGFVSNFLFGQGPLSPWQMFGFGIIGFLAGVIFYKKTHKKILIPLCIFGGFATLIIYGVLLDTASMLMASGGISWGIWLGFLTVGIPFNIIHGIATVIFLWVLAPMMIEKLDRVKKKYGIMQA